MPFVIVRFGSVATHGPAPFAEAIAAQVAVADPEDGVVFGIVGPWGSGKTSLLHMVEEVLEEDHGGFKVLWFNPWLFSGTEHLVGIFFTELGAQLGEIRGVEWHELGAAMRSYGELLVAVRTLPVIGGSVASAGRRGRKKGVRQDRRVRRRLACH